MSSRDEPKASKRGLGRREFVKLVSGTSAAVSAGVLTNADLLGAQTTTRSKTFGPGVVPMALRVNGHVRQVTLEPRVTLLDALRDSLNLTGAKKVCDRGTCGACTVIVNEKSTYSCTMLAIEAAMSGANIETIEGLAPDGEFHVLSSTFVQHDAQQCGFCTPGFVMAAKAYIDAHPNPTYQQVQRSLGGNLCRCGTYMGVRRAVVDAAMKMKGGKS